MFEEVPEVTVCNKMEMLRLSQYSIKQLLQHTKGHPGKMQRRTYMTILQRNVTEVRAREI